LLSSKQVLDIIYVKTQFDRSLRECGYSSMCVCVIVAYVVNRVRIRFNVINSLFEDIFAQFENTEGGQEDTDDDVSPQVSLLSTPVHSNEIHACCLALDLLQCIRSYCVCRAFRRTQVFATL